MKKNILKLMALSFISLNAFSWEVNAKAGFDFLRASHTETDSIKNIKIDGIGFNLGAEIIPLDFGKVEFGGGFEYNFGLKSERFSQGKNAGFSKDAYLGLNNETKMFAPMYLLSRVKMYSDNVKKVNVYAVARVGGVYTNYLVEEQKQNNKIVKEVVGGGVYYGLGFGANYKYFTTELLYDGAFIPEQKEKFEHKVGLKLGIRLGSFMEPRKEEIKTCENNKNMLIQKEYIEAPKIEDSKIYRPNVSDLLVKLNQKVTIKDIENLIDKNTVPKGTIVEEIEKLDTSSLGNKTAKYRVVYPDKTSKEIEVSVNIVPELFHAYCVDNKCVIKGFGFDKNVPEKKVQNNMKELVKVINQYAKGTNLTIIGHTDSTGYINYNYKLGFERAMWIVNNLKKNGLDKSIQVKAVESMGEINPIDKNNTKIGRYNNRRVELIFDNKENK